MRGRRHVFVLFVVSFFAACGARTELADPFTQGVGADGGVRDARADASDAGRVRPPVSCEDGGAGTRCGGDGGVSRCVDLTNDPNDCGRCGTRCRAEEACISSRCVAVAAAFTGLRWELPCVTRSGRDSCTTPGLVKQTARMGGERGVTYDVTLHFRGVVETEGYVGGTNDGAYFQIGGAPINDTWNIYALETSSPPATYYLNRGEGGLYRCFPIDYRATIPIAAGATVTLVADPVDSATEEIVNTDGTGVAIVVPGVPPAPAAFDGQFIQMDVEVVR
ncbi:MAG: hypothetical protein U0235_05645 [Polyangiaceae bacterium]